MQGLVSDLSESMHASPHWEVSTLRLGHERIEQEVVAV